MWDKRYESGFTLAELLVALIVSGIILAAVATLAFAMSSASVSTDDTSGRQAQVRFATLRISELIRHCKLICAESGDDLVIWKADDNPQDGKIDVLELAYIEPASSKDRIRILEFSDCPVWLNDWFRIQPSQISALKQSWLKEFFVSRCETTDYELISGCNNVEFSLDVPEKPPLSKFLGISFDIIENNIVRHYQIDNALRSWAGNLLSADGLTIVSDDD